jgi:translation initiation factor IF-2
VIIIFEPTVEEVQIDKDLLDLANKNKIHIIKSNSIYRLKEMYQKYCDNIKNKIREEHIGLIDCELEILPNCVFLKTSPLLFGVKVKSGKLNIGTKLLAISTKDDKPVVLGIVKSMEKERKPITVGEVKDEICIRVEMIDKKIIYKTDFDESYKVTTYKSDQDKIICEIFKNELK